MPKTIPISIPLGSEVSDQLNDLVRSKKITKKQANQLQQSLYRCYDQFGQLELRFNPSDGSISLADNPQPVRADNDPGDEEGDEEGAERSVGGSTSKGKSIWWEERFTSGKWVRLPVREVHTHRGRTTTVWKEKLVKGKWVRTGKVESFRSN